MKNGYEEKYDETFDFLGRHITEAEKEVKSIRGDGTITDQNKLYRAEQLSAAIKAWKNFIAYKGILIGIVEE